MRQLLFLLCLTALSACGGAQTPVAQPKPEAGPPEDNLSDENAVYRGACENGDQVACHALATRLEAEFRHDAAMGYYVKSCDGGYALGCAAAGERYYNGQITTRDFAKARDYLGKGCDGGDLPACTTLATLYASGDGVDPDPDQARALYQRACQGGYHYACDFVND